MGEGDPDKARDAVRKKGGREISVCGGECV